MNLQFPKNFFWGSSTSAHQVEGGNINSWSEWEKENAERLAKEAEKAPIWQKIKFPEALKAENYISGRACDHYNRFEEDFDIAKSLWQNAHRFSIEWSRIEPQEGKFNEDEIEHYRQVVLALLDRGIEPFVGLWHWTNPLWIEKNGGWENKKTVKYFTRYVKKIVETLGDDIKFWITLNEPNVYVGNSFLAGIWPPQKKSLLKTKCVLKNLASAHIRAYGVIHNNDAEAQVGFANNLIFFEAYENKFTNRILKRAADYFWNNWFFKETSPCNDFIGCNYYFHNRIKVNWLNPKNSFNQNANKEISDFGWEIYPEGIYHILKDLKKYDLPVYITENGLADARDEKRAEFIREHLKNVHRAIQEGVNARGYFHWSLLDNFEWEKGFWPRFGLVEIDYLPANVMHQALQAGKTLERKIRPSAYEYAKICKNNTTI